jgi:hypothetical protein
MSYNLLTQWRLSMNSSIYLDLNYDLWKYKCEPPKAEFYRQQAGDRPEYAFNAFVWRHHIDRFGDQDTKLFLYLFKSIALQFVI